MRRCIKTAVCSTQRNEHARERLEKLISKKPQCSASSAGEVVLIIVPLKTRLW